MLRLSPRSPHSTTDWQRHAPGRSLLLLRAVLMGESGRGTGPLIDWDDLRARAVQMTQHAYAPYSDFLVGAAGLVDDGRVVVGCNVENAAYGVTLCAECGMVSALHASGGGRLVAVACRDRLGTPLMPCGRCRQLLWENGGPGCLVDTPQGMRTMDQVLPQAFGADELERVSEGVEQRRTEERGTA